VSICIIPARGGSKRIPGKNILPFCGKPMIVWSIEAAVAANCFERIIVSTDDKHVAEIAKAANAEVPFVRPSALADDHATTVTVMQHAIEFLATEGKLPEALCCLYATAPFVSAADLYRGATALQDADFAMPVTRYAFPIQRAVRIDDAGQVQMFHPEFHSTRSQDLEEALHDAGQFYWGRTSAWQSDVPLFEQRVMPIELPRWRVQDIDTPEDWTQAEAMFHALRKHRCESTWHHSCNQPVPIDH